MKNNLLIVESGSTKADWLFVEKSGEYMFTTEGINPTILSNVTELRLESDIRSRLMLTQRVFFYGAGVTSPQNKYQIKEMLVLNGVDSQVCFEIHSDLVAAAKSTIGDDDGIISILGTGSNTGVQKNQVLHTHRPSLGYLLSDEGSGVAIGKKLLKEYFYNTVPDDVRTKLEQEHEMDRSSVLDALYSQPKPNVYLASFSSIFNECNDNDWKESFMKEIFRVYIQERILTIEDYVSYDLHFVGSIAYFYRSYLEMTLSEFDLTAKSIVKSPLIGLADYHKRKEN